ncbi:hypothetical protein ACHAW6_016101 [Cyclotella cf. meneghiniana]
MRRVAARRAKAKAKQQEDLVLDKAITWAEDGHTALAKLNTALPQRVYIDKEHTKPEAAKPSILQSSKNWGYALQSTVKGWARKVSQDNTHVTFAKQALIQAFNKNDAPVMASLDSGADNHYISEKDRKKLNLPILKKSSRRVGVANGGISKGVNVTQLPFKQLSATAVKADTFNDFPDSLISVGQLADDDTVSIFSKDGVSVHKEEDVLITVNNEPILIGVRDEQGRYRIPLQQHKGQWKPRLASKKARQTLRQANSVYDLPSTEQAIKWMHAVCGYPVKTTWLKAIKAGNYIGWPLITFKNVSKYYPETIETPKGHLNQARKNVRSTKPKPFITTSSTQLRGKKVQDIHTQVYEVRDTVFTDQTGQFPTQARSGNKYIMVMVDIDSSGILVEPIKSRKDAELHRAYTSLMTRLNRAGIFPKKHVLDNEVSQAMKDFVRDKYNMTVELVPPGCHRRNAAEVAIRNFKAHFLSILAGTAEDFPLQLWDKLLPQAEITVNLLRQSNSTPTISAYAHMNGPFDYNKMPLAPLGCNVQVHEKTDTRGTWAFHSVDGWYIQTSPEHYRTHKCHIKSTNCDRFSDTVQFQHKRITNPSVSAKDKLMNAIAACQQALNNATNDTSNSEISMLQSILNQARQKVTGETMDTPVTQSLPRVQMNTNSQPPQDEGKRTTRSMTAMLTPGVAPPSPSIPHSAPRVQTPALPIRKRRKRIQVPVPTYAPAANTRSKTKEKEHQRKLGQKPAGQPKRASYLHQPTRNLRSTRKRFKQIENDVHKALAVMDKKSGKMLNYRQLLHHPDYKKDWCLSSANEFGRLANGVGGRIKNPTNTIKFVKYEDIPKDRRNDVTYGQFVCTVRPEKKEPNRTRFVVGGDKINYPGEVATPTADMLVAKLLFNSVVSTPDAKFMTMDLSDFYLMTPLTRPEYIRIKMTDIPQEIIKEYKLRSIVSNDGFIYIMAIRGMYGLPQSGLLANQLLEKRLNKHGYFQSKYIPGLWKHNWRPVQFTLVVDDFGVKYVGKEHALHLKEALEQDYTVTTEWDGRRYIGITLDWDYERRRVHLSMPGYVAKALKLFQHRKSPGTQNAPYPSVRIIYGAKKQFATETSNAPLLNPSEKKFIQKVCGKFLFLGRAVDPTLLCPISAIASQSSKPTTDTMKQTLQLLDYLASQEEAVITYNASDMILAAHSDASYLSEPQARSRAGGHFFLSSNAEIPPNNGAVLNIAHIIKHVMSSATEAELGALYIMAREAVYIRIILEEMGHKQPPTPLQTDNSMADGVVNGNIQPKRTKAMDMRFHWLRDRECQEQFRIYWRPGKLNYADYWTKHHPATHHKNIRKEFLTPMIMLEMLRQEHTNTVRKTPAAAAESVQHIWKSTST